VDNVFEEIPVGECDGSSGGLTSCTSIDMLIFSQSPYNLVQGDEIVARISAYNDYGTGSPSLESTTNALVAVVPLKPSATPFRDTGTDET